MELKIVSNESRPIENKTSKQPKASQLAFKMLCFDSYVIRPINLVQSLAPDLHCDYFPTQYLTSE